MRFFADENLAWDIVLWLRESGHDVLCAAEAAAGASDNDWLIRSELELRTILTSDKDFGELVFRDRLNSHGVVLLRLNDLTVAEALAHLQNVWSIVEINHSKRFIVISEQKTRVRRLP